jgi:hypothetical protein
MEGFLGIDIGSVTTKMALIDRKGEILWRSYKKTAGQPLKVLQNTLLQLRNELGEINVLGVGATGSGRKLVDYIIGADEVKNEITAHAVAAVHVMPAVRTVLEIGGQDSKLIFIFQIWSAAFSTRYQILKLILKQYIFISDHMWLLTVISGCFQKDPPQPISDWESAEQWVKRDRRYPSFRNLWRNTTPKHRS